MSEGRPTAIACGCRLQVAEHHLLVFKAIDSEICAARNRERARQVRADGEASCCWRNPASLRLTARATRRKRLTFLDRMQLVLRHCGAAVTSCGRIAVLIGGYSDRGRYQPLPALLVERAIREWLWPAGTAIIRLQHGNTSSRKQYRSSFISGLHDTCLVFEHR